MKIPFNDGGWIELYFHPESDNYRITIAAHNPQKPTEKIVNSAEITTSQMNLLLTEIKK